tara:strand:+ start:131 stop:514 length:384 start_codon:yes stop_codon:yes gene_type:complete
MLINIPVSLGELVDKISILIVKKKNINDHNKINLIKKELTLLEEVLFKNIQKEKINNYLKQLVDINSKLWIIEDDLRELERKKQFDQNFTKLARSVYFTNDNRAQIKLEINKVFGSELVEVKSYEKY